MDINHSPQPMQLLLFFFSSLHLLWPLFLHYGTSESRDHINSPSPLVYWVELLEVFHYISNGINGEKKSTWARVSFSPHKVLHNLKKAHWVATFFSPPLYNELLYIRVVVFVWGFFLSFVYSRVFAKKHTETLRCPEVLWISGKTSYG